MDDLRCSLCSLCYCLASCMAGMILNLGRNLCLRSLLSYIYIYIYT